jgi:hypothetical protein
MKDLILDPVVIDYRIGAVLAVPNHPIIIIEEENNKETYYITTRHRVLYGMPYWGVCEPVENNTFIVQ